MQYLHGNTARQIDEAKKHVLFQHNPKNCDGYITIAQKDSATNTFTQYHYRPDDLAEHLSEIMGENVFFSQNTFYKPQRRIETIRQLRSLYVDLDFYILNYDRDWILGKLEYEFYRQTIPEPNMIIFSGQGVVLIWRIEPVPYKALPLWQAVQSYLIDQLKPLGADSHAADAARIFRLAGSTSSKNGQEVHVQYRLDFEYNLRQLQYDYLPDIEPKNQAKKRGRKKKIVHLFNTYSLHHARLMDLTKLVELRGGDIRGSREVFCFLYRYWTCCFTDDAEEAMSQVKGFNDTFTHPLPKRELLRATKSAETAWSKKSDQATNEAAKALGFPGAGYRLKNTTIIRWLEITEEEQRHLSTIIGRKEKNRRKREAYKKNRVEILKRQKKQKEKKRRENGVPKRDIYIQNEKEKTCIKVEQLREAMIKNKGLSNVKLAKLLDISEATIRRLKKRL